MRWVTIILAIAAITLQGQLWLADDGHRKTRQLRIAVTEQLEQNAALKARNASLDAEVLNLKNGRAAAEERARTDLGLIGKNETFFQVVPVAQRE